MKKAVWIAFGVSLVMVNLAAWLVTQFSGVEINMFFRITLIFGITLITTIFAGSYLLIDKMDEERPLTGHAADSVGSDKSEK